MNTAHADGLPTLLRPESAHRVIEISGVRVRLLQDTHQSHLIHRVLQYIDRHYTAPLKLDDLSAQFSLDKFYKQQMERPEKCIPAAPIFYTSLRLFSIC